MRTGERRVGAAGTAREERGGAENVAAPGKRTLVEFLTRRGGQDDRDFAAKTPAPVELTAGELIEVLEERGELGDTESAPDHEDEDSPGVEHEASSVQRSSASGASREAAAAAAGPTARAGFSGPAEQLPHLDLVQRSFGRHSVGDIRAHIGGSAAESANALGATAYAAGDQVAFAGPPTLHTAAHEAAHVVQQRAGAASVHNAGRAGDRFEQHADRVADMVVAGQSAETALDEMAATGGGAASELVQHQPRGGLPEPPFSDEKLQSLTKEQLQELYDRYRKTNPAEANKVKKWQKSMGFRGSSLKKGGKAKKFLRIVGKGGKVIIPLIFLHDWYEGGFWNATKNTANDLTWPLSELWD
jgi:Domain of unknown function (DUF4157)